MNTGITIKDMPKLYSPFEREKVDGKYVCIPKIREGFEWVFKPDTLAVDKLDGTNVSILVRDGQVIRMFNRTNQIPFFSKNSDRFYQGISNALRRGYFIPGDDGQFFGELIGPKIQGNPYQLDEYLWVPFEHLKRKYYFKFWQEFIAEVFSTHDFVRDDTVIEIGPMKPQLVFEEISELFKSLWSVFKRSRKVSGEISDVTADLPFTGLAAEGIVFYSPDGKMAKLRRDMFDWYTGRTH